MRLDERLLEINYGTWEGLTLPEVKQEDPSTLRRREDNTWDVRVPDGESYRDVEARVAAFLAVVEPECIVIAHAGVFQVLSVIFGHATQKLAPHLQVPQGELLALEDLNEQSREDTS
jgi:probable phosphoglycerate mutase